MARPVTSEPSHLRRLRVLAQHIAPDEAHEVLYGAPASVFFFVDYGSCVVACRVAWSMMIVCRRATFGSSQEEGMEGGHGRVGIGDVLVHFLKSKAFHALSALLDLFSFVRGQAEALDHAMSLTVTDNRTGKTYTGASSTPAGRSGPGWLPWGGMYCMCVCVMDCVC